MRSFLDLYDLASRTATTVYETGNPIEAPNWSPDGSWLLFNCNGLLYRLPVVGGEPEVVDTGFARECNNDHGIAPDGSQIALSDKVETGSSCIYLMPVEGGTPQRVTTETPSWWHGWSPDGKRLAYTAVRDGLFSIRTIAVEGGKETIVVESEMNHHYDGPDYTPDGRWIWFNSNRGGSMQLWRVYPDGSGLEQMTQDERVNWFPHPSPDGKNIVYLAYQNDVEGHPFGRDVELRMMPSQGGSPEILSSIFGGQGTINVPSWAPESGAFAYVRYEKNAVQGA